MDVHAPRAASGILLLVQLEEEEVADFAVVDIIDEGALSCPTNSVSTMERIGSVIIPARAGRAIAIVCADQL
jgi:hypothetical protein